VINKDRELIIARVSVDDCYGSTSYTGHSFLSVKPGNLTAVRIKSAN